MEASILNKLIESIPNGLKRRTLTMIYNEMGLMEIPLKTPENINPEEWAIILNNTTQLNIMLDIALKLK